MKKDEKMPKTLEKEKEEKKSKPGFFSLADDDLSPNIGIATKEPLPEYIKGVKAEFKRIEWPSKDQAVQEFIAVIVIVAIIASLVFLIDIGFDKIIGYISGVR